MVVSARNGLLLAVYPAAQRCENSIHLQNEQVLEGTMQQPQVTIYADITEIRQETRAAERKKLLENGWVLLGVYPLTTAEEPKQRKSRERQQERNPKDTPRYVQRMVGYVVCRKREQGCLRNEPF
jgi:hypothetical protein